MSRRYALEFAPKALRALRKLDRPVVERIAGYYRVLYRSTMTGWWSWSWTLGIAARSTVSVLAGGSERIRGLDHETAR